MKRMIDWLRRKRTLLITAFCMIISLAYFTGMAFASEESVPGKVRKLKAEADDQAVVLSWRKASGADGYTIRVTRADTGKHVRTYNVKRANTTEKKIAGLSNGVSYQFRIRAWKRTSNGKITGSFSKTVTARPQLKRPDKPVAEIVEYTNGIIKFRWDAVDDADGYEVSLKNASGKYEVLRTLKKGKLSYTAQNLSPGKKYHFGLCAIRKSGNNVLKSKRTVIKASILSEEEQKALSDTVNISNVNNTGDYNAGLVYKRQTAECYVNYGNDGGPFSSLNNYLVWVNLYTQRTFMFKRSSESSPWKMVWSTPCITGKLGSVTPYGVYKFGWASPRHNYSDVRYAQYLSFFIGSGISIHTFMYPDNDEFENNPASFSRGYMGSEGCVRLPRQYAKYIFNHCLNTKGEVVKVTETGSTIIIH